MEDYLTELNKDINDKNLDNFWVICNEEFKPIKKSKSEVKKILKEKAEKYANKKIANIQLIIHDKGIQSDSWVFAIKITIFIIDTNGNIEKSPEDQWGLHLKYNQDELLKHKFKFGYLEKLLKKVVSKKVTSNMLFGSYYSELKI